MSSNRITTSYFFFFSSRRRHTRWNCDWSSDVCSSDLRRVHATSAEKVRFLTGVQRVITPSVEMLKSGLQFAPVIDRKSTRLNSSHSSISYAVFCLKKKKVKALAHDPPCSSTYILPTHY